MDSAEPTPAVLNLKSDVSMSQAQTPQHTPRIKAKNGISKRNRKQKINKAQASEVSDEDYGFDTPAQNTAYRMVSFESQTNKTEDISVETRPGVLSSKERLLRVQRYFEKKRRTQVKPKYSYKCREIVANKRLRVKGRFMTREQAFKMLGLTED